MGKDDLRNVGLVLLGTPLAALLNTAVAAVVLIVGAGLVAWPHVFVRWPHLFRRGNPADPLPDRDARADARAQLEYFRRDRSERERPG